MDTFPRHWMVKNIEVYEIVSGQKKEKDALSNSAVQRHEYNTFGASCQAAHMKAIGFSCQVFSLQTNRFSVQMECWTTVESTYVQTNQQTMSPIDPGVKESLSLLFVYSPTHFEHLETFPTSCTESCHRPCK